MSDAEELERRLAEVEAREQELSRRERAFEAKGLHRNLYDRLNVSARTVDAVIVACIVAITVLIAVGMYLNRGR